MLKSLTKTIFSWPSEEMLKFLLNANAHEYHDMPDRSLPSMLNNF